MTWNSSIQNKMYVMVSENMEIGLTIFKGTYTI